MQLLTYGFEEKRFKVGCEEIYCMIREVSWDPRRRRAWASKYSILSDICTVPYVYKKVLVGVPHLKG